VFAGLLDLRRVRVQAVHEEAVARAQGSRQLPIAAAQMDDEAARDARGLKNRPGLAFLGLHGRSERPQRQNQP